MLIQQVRLSEGSRNESLSAAAEGQIPAVALTAYAGELDRQRAIEAGFQTHLAKPVEPVELVLLAANLAILTKPK